MSDTPRTNAACNQIAKSGVDWHHSAKLVADFARELERSLMQFCAVLGIPITSNDTAESAQRKVEAALQTAKSIKV